MFVDKYSRPRITHQEDHRLALHFPLQRFDIRREIRSAPSIPKDAFLFRQRPRSLLRLVARDLYVPSGNVSG